MILLLPLWTLAGFLLAQIIIAVGIVILQLMGAVSDEQLQSAFVNTLLSGVIYLVTLAIVVGGPWLILKKKTNAKEIGLHRLPNWLEVLTSPVAFVVYIICSAIIVNVTQTFLLPFLNYEQPQVTGFEGISQQYEYILAFITLVIIAPVAEEILFRGYLLGKLRKFAPTWIAIVVSSLLFGLVHFNPSVSVDTFVLGLVLAWMTVKTKSLWPAILIHMIKNGLAFYLLFINPSFLSTIGG